MFKNKNEYYETNPINLKYNENYYSSREIQQKRGEDLARRLHMIKPQIKAKAYTTSPVQQSNFNTEEVFINEFLKLSDFGKGRFINLIWVKNVEEELSEIWPEFTNVVNGYIKTLV